MKKIENYKTIYLVGGIITILIIFFFIFQIGKRNGEKSSEASIKFLNEKIHFYNSIDSLKLPIMVSSLKKVNLDLNTVMDKVINTSQMKEVNDSLEDLTKSQFINIHTLTLNLEKILSEKDSILKELNSLKKSIPILNSKSQNYKLKQGEGAFLVKNLISIGIENITSSQVLFNINNTSDTLSVGNNTNINIGGIKGKLALTLINNSDTLNPYCRMEFLLIK